LKEDAPLNIQLIDRTEETSQEDKSPLKEDASKNIDTISVTEETSQEDKSPLKEDASKNIAYILVTDETSQEDKSPLKEDATLNILFISVTLETSQAEMFSLKKESNSNKLPILVRVSKKHQSSIGPYVPVTVASLNCVTAFLSSKFVPKHCCAASTLMKLPQSSGIERKSFIYFIFAGVLRVAVVFDIVMNKG